MQVIQPGHKYLFQGVECIAVEPDAVGNWWLRELANPWIGARRLAKPAQCIPLPMKYFHGQVPA